MRIPYMLQCLGVRVEWSSVTLKSSISNNQGLVYSDDVESVKGGMISTCYC